MSTVDELQEILISRLFDEASKPGSHEEISGTEIISLLLDKTGAPIANQVIRQLLHNGYLRQTRAISDEAGGHYEITPTLIHYAEQSNQAKIGSSDGPSFTEFKDCVIIALYHKSNVDGLKLHYLKALADEMGKPYREGWVFEVADFLDKHGLAVVAKVMGGDKDQTAKLNADGLEYAEALIAQLQSEELVRERKSGTSDNALRAVWHKCLPVLRYVTDNWIKATIGKLANTLIAYAAKLFGFF